MAVSAQAAGLTLNEANSDDQVATVQNTPGNPGTNQVAWWVDYLEGKGINGATCVKVDNVDKKTWTIPAPPEGTEFVLVTSKAANEAALDGKKANLVWWAPKAAEGNIVTAVADKDISHIIWCTVPKKTTTPPVTTTPPHSTPPVVDTDRVATTGSGAGLGLYGAVAALLVGAGAIVIGRRRQGAHR